MRTLPYNCHLLRPWINRLRKVVFPDDRGREKDDVGLYSRMKLILREGKEDP